MPPKAQRRGAVAQRRVAADILTYQECIENPYPGEGCPGFFLEEAAVEPGEDPISVLKSYPNMSAEVITNIDANFSTGQSACVREVAIPFFTKYYANFYAVKPTLFGRPVKLPDNYALLVAFAPMMATFQLAHDILSAETKIPYTDRLNQIKSKCHQWDDAMPLCLLALMIHFNNMVVRPQAENGHAKIIIRGFPDLTIERDPDEDGNARPALKLTGRDAATENFISMIGNLDSTAKVLIGPNNHNAVMLNKGSPFADAFLDKAFIHQQGNGPLKIMSMIFGENDINVSHSDFECLKLVALKAIPTAQVQANPVPLLVLSTYFDRLDIRRERIRDGENILLENTPFWSADERAEMLVFLNTLQKMILAHRSATSSAAGRSYIVALEKKVDQHVLNFEEKVNRVNKTASDTKDELEELRVDRRLRALEKKFGDLLEEFEEVNDANRRLRRANQELQDRLEARQAWRRQREPSEEGQQEQEQEQE